MIINDCDDIRSLIEASGITLESVADFVGTSWQLLGYHLRRNSLSNSDRALALRAVVAILEHRLREAQEAVESIEVSDEADGEVLEV